MDANTRSGITTACHWLMRPVVALLLRSGMTWQQFADIIKLIFVRVATEEYGRGGRPTNVSRVAILTGLSRREVTRLRRLNGSESGGKDDARISSAARVLSGWHQDAEFLDPFGRPARLARDGEHPSFETLLKRYAGDIPPVALLRELLEAAAVRRNADGTLDALSRYYMPAPMDANALMRAGSVWRDLGDTVEFNLARGESQAGRFEGRATNRKLRCDALPDFCRLIESKGQALLEDADRWLSAHETADDNGAIRAGLGIYLIEDPRRNQ